MKKQVPGNAGRSLGMLFLFGNLRLNHIKEKELLAYQETYK